MTQQERLDKINTLGLDEAQAYLMATHRSTLPQMDKNDLIIACEERIARLDRSQAFVEETDMSDFGNG